MFRHDQDDQDTQQSAPRRTPLYNKNASSFDILSFNPDSQANSKAQDRSDKLQKQAAYRDELNSMVTSKGSQRGNQRVQTENYSNISREQEYGQERRVEHRQVDAEQRRYDEESNAQDKKKRMQQEINDSNKRAAEQKAINKKRDKANELATDNQRAQDSLSQFERDGYRQKESKRAMNEENTRVLEQQLRNSNNRKTQDTTTPSYDSVDNLHYYQNDKYSQNPLGPSYSKMNQAPPQSLDKLSSQMNKLTTNCPFATDDTENAVQSQQSYGRKRYEEPQSHNTIDNGSQYQKNRQRNQNAGYNIINFQ